MYTPQHFAEPDIEMLQALMRSYPLGAWVAQVEDGLVVNHIPFLVDTTRGEYGTLVGHVARANPIWKSFARGITSVVIFQGPQAYVSPSWYPSKQAHGKVVPTWNYAVVHAHGVPSTVEDRTWLLQHVTQLSAVHEADRPVPWSVSDAPPEYVGAMLEAIVGIEIPIAELQGKWKTSQNRPLPDRLGVIAGLQERGDAGSRQMADLVQSHAGRRQD